MGFQPVLEATHGLEAHATVGHAAAGPFSFSNPFGKEHSCACNGY
jgi:hypothetical protein